MFFCAKLDNFNSRRQTFVHTMSLSSDQSSMFTHAGVSQGYGQEPAGIKSRRPQHDVIIRPHSPQTVQKMCVFSEATEATRGNSQCRHTLVANDGCYFGSSNARARTHAARHNNSGSHADSPRCPRATPEPVPRCFADCESRGSRANTRLRRLCTELCASPDNVHNAACAHPTTSGHIYPWPLFGPS